MTNADTGAFKRDLEALLAEYDDIDDDRLRDAAYQVVDFWGEDNPANEVNWQ